MKRFLFDVNVVLDAILKRQPFVADAGALWQAAEEGRIDARVPAHGVTTIAYIAQRHCGREEARRLVGEVLRVLRVAAVDEQVLGDALSLGWPDFEDAVCASAAARAGCQLLVTRDPDGFRDSPVFAVDPGTALALIRSR